MNMEVFYVRFNGCYKVFIYLYINVEFKVINELDWNSFLC